MLKKLPLIFFISYGFGSSHPLLIPIQQNHYNSSPIRAQNIENDDEEDEKPSLIRKSFTVLMWGSLVSLVTIFLLGNQKRLHNLETNFEKTLQDFQRAQDDLQKKQQEFERETETSQKGIQEFLNQSEALAPELQRTFEEHLVPSLKKIQRKIGEVRQ